MCDTLADKHSSSICTKVSLRKLKTNHTRKNPTSVSVQ